ncbi:hypothetical protein ACEN8K_42825, partial [Variovorax sp. CT11-76]
ARRALQLKLLTKRGDPAPAQTWGQDAGKVLAAAHDVTSAQRLQRVLQAPPRARAPVASPAFLGPLRAAFPFSDFRRSPHGLHS